MFHCPSVSRGKNCVPVMLGMKPTPPSEVSTSRSMRSRIFLFVNVLAGTSKTGWAEGSSGGGANCGEQPPSKEEPTTRAMKHARRIRFIGLVALDSSLLLELRLLLFLPLD